MFFHQIILMLLWSQTSLIYCCRERSSSPKFIVTLDGADSDMEDKYDDQVKKEKKKRRSKKKAEVDDFEDIDTSDVVEKIEPLAAITTPEKPAIKQITFDLNVEGNLACKELDSLYPC